MNKIIRWSMLAVLGLCSPAVLALGLGGAVVQSYLDQPLDVRIDLISQNEAELQSITARLASAEDFELLGMSIAAIAVPLEFEVVTDADRPYIHVTSRLKVNEPVVQVLVEVVWASGRMLREYTLFLDPPTIDSPAPPATVKPATVRPAPAEVSDSPVTPIQKKAASARETTQSSATESATASTEGQQQTPAGQAGDDEVYGPVASGETLWGIAREYSRGSGYTINQTMLALQRKNPKAFINGNINSLRRGAILRLPAFNEIAELTSREALIEVLRQEEEARGGVRSVAPDLTTPTVAESGDYQSSAVAEEPEPVPEEDAGHLELVPPAETESVTQDTLGEESTGEPAPVMETPAVESLQEELSRTEEELLNARQENSYLTERIKELEAEAAAREEQALAVSDPDLANLESRLAEERESGQPEAPVAITPGGEEQAWYAGKTPLLLGIAVVLIGLITWALRRRGAVVPAAFDDAEALADAGDNKRAAIDGSDDAATVVQTAPKAVAEPEPVVAPVVSGEPELEIVPDLPGEPLADEPQPFADFPEAEGPTVVLRKTGTDIEDETGPEADFETIDEAPDLAFEDEPEEEPVQSEDDPEIKLDLARAYLSLGDKEASRSMLDEVLKSGNPAQKAEARQMLEEL